jgi:hypothetical protein
MFDPTTWIWRLRAEIADSPHHLFNSLFRLPAQPSYLSKLQMMPAIPKLPSLAPLKSDATDLERDVEARMST